MWHYEKPDNQVEWWETSVDKFRNNTLFWIRNDQNTLDPMTYGEVGRRIDNARGGLAAAGIREGDFVGIIANNRPEWCILSYATYGRNARFVPMYEKERPETWKYIITDSRVKVLIVSSQAIYDNVKGFINEIPTLEKIYLIDGDGDNSLKALETSGTQNPVEPIVPSPEDIAILIYTSGTTGDPKGVLLSHGNLTYTSRGGHRIYPELNATHVGLSILPWAHSYALSGELNNWIQFGGSLGFMREVATLAEDLKLVRPTYLVCVPRLFNKIYDGIMARMEEEGGLKKKLFNTARKTAKKKRKLLEGQKVVIDKSVVEAGAEDGEIIIYGPNVMKGYHNKPEETQKVMTMDGGFRSGDRGRFDKDGFLYITGRIKEQYKLQNGKYVFPHSIEEDIKLLPNVTNAMVYGEGRPYNICLVFPDFDVLGKYAQKNDIPSDPESLVKNNAVTDMMEKEIVAYLKTKYGGYEIPKKFFFLTSDFTLANGMITQTLKLKRRVVVKGYQDLIDAAYAETGRYR